MHTCLHVYHIAKLLHVHVCKQLSYNYTTLHMSLCLVHIFVNGHA